MACGRGACQDTAHLYGLFITRRHGTDADQVGSKFFYHCASCRGLVCVDDLGLRGGYPCPPGEVEAHPFACPRCGGRVSVLRADHAHGWDAAGELLDFLRAVEGGTGPERVWYEGDDATVHVAPGTLAHVPFGPRPRPMRPGEMWETVVWIDDDTGEMAGVVLEHRDHPEPRTRLFLRQGDERVPLRAPLPEVEVWSSGALDGEIPGEWAGIATLSLGAGGVLVAHAGTAGRVTVDREGICPAGPDEEEPADLPRNRRAAPPPEGSAEAAERVRIAGALREATEMRVWDYEWLEAPRPGEAGPDAVLALAGSTDLSYYQLVRVVFRGVRHFTCPPHFHHPAFLLATPAEELQLRELLPFGERSFAVRVVEDFGSRLSRTYQVVCDAVEVTPLDGDARKSRYHPARPENADWWWEPGT